jgi:hypothetical protein
VFGITYLILSNSWIFKNWALDWGCVMVWRVSRWSTPSLVAGGTRSGPRREVAHVQKVQQRVLNDLNDLYYIYIYWYIYILLIYIDNHESWSIIIYIDLYWSMIYNYIDLWSTMYVDFGMWRANTWVLTHKLYANNFKAWGTYWPPLQRDATKSHMCAFETRRWNHCNKGRWFSS